jgi:hypothetical protein
VSTQHPTVELIAGDDWEIAITMLDDAGNPFDLTGATISWTLIDDGGQQFIAPDEVTVSVATDPTTGVATVTVPGTVTTRLKTFLYHDATRIVVAGVTTTILVGDIKVTSDPFVPPVPVYKFTSKVTGAMGATEAADTADVAA